MQEEVVPTTVSALTGDCDSNLVIEDEELIYEEREEDSSMCENDPAGLLSKQDLKDNETMTEKLCVVKQTGTSKVNVPADISVSCESGKVQPNLRSYPKHQIGGKYRSFTNSFYDKYPWIEYSVENDSVFCFYCRHFPNNNNADSPFSCSGFRNWKKCYGSNEKENKLLQYHYSSIHEQAVSEYDAFLTLKKTKRFEEECFRYVK